MCEPAGYRDAHEATSMLLHNVMGLTKALELAIHEHPALDKPGIATDAIHALQFAIEGILDKAQALHDAEWALIVKPRSP